MTQSLAEPHLDTPAAARATPTVSVVVPVYCNVGTLAELVARLQDVSARLEHSLEAIFVVDGSPDDSGALLRELLSERPLRARLVWHSRNFGAFAAVRTGLGLASGKCIVVMAADLQEPVSLLEDFHAALADGCHDVAVGVRRSRQDPALAKFGARWFWAFYCRWIQPQMPRGGVDVFACTPKVRDALLALEESNSSLVGLLIWLGFQRVEIPYDRQPREHGHSAWTLRKRTRYLLDSIYSFTDLPITLLLVAGVSGVLMSIVGGLVVFFGWLLVGIKVAGYTPIMLTLFVIGSLTLSGLGVVGSYVWRTYENSKRRPGAVKTLVEDFDA